MNYRIGHRLGLILLFGGIGLGFIAAMMKVSWLELVGVCLSLAGIGMDIIVYRCPCCHKSLAGHGRRPEHCPHCGAALESGKTEDSELR